MDFEGYQNYAIAAVIVLALLVIVTLLLRAIGGRVRARQGSRLGISEYQEIDKQRQLVLIRRDGVEHLLMIGGAQDLVIETGIVASSSVAEAPRYEHPRPVPVDPETRLSPVLARPEPEESRAVPLRAAPRPAVFGDRPQEAMKRRAEPRLEPVRKAEEEPEA